MSEQWKIYKNILVSSLRDLADEAYQRRIWLNLDNPDSLIDSFVETVNAIFDDALITDALQNNQIVFDKKVTQALQELDEAVDEVDEYRHQKEIIADPLMEIVREKAANVLALIEASDGKESTVEIVE